MKLSRVWILFAMSSATIMQTLDSTIINVALPHMTGELGATPDSISWVVTSYMIAAAVFMPLTGFLNDRLGRKRFLLISIGGFVASSVLCGIAVTLPEMVAFRLLQGIFGGMMVPLSQAVIVDNFPGEERVRAMAIYSMGLMVAPIAGPTLGGFLTDTLSWRWNFYINLPVGLLSLFLAARYVPDTPTKQRDMDWIGFATLATAIACLQLVLDRGAEKDWFESTMICTAAAVAGVAFLAFLWENLAGSGHPIFDLTVLKDRNLAVSCVIMLCTGFGVLGSTLLIPLFMETQLGLPAMDAGLWMMPRSLVAVIIMALVGRYAHRFKPRNLIFAGMLAYCMSALLLTGMTPQASVSVFLLPNIVGGIGMALLFVPLATLAFATVPRHMTSEASGVYGLMRSIGMSFGVSLAVTYLNYSTKGHWNGMRSMVTPYNQSIHTFLQHAGQTASYFFDPSGLHLNSLGLALMARLVQQQAMVKAYVSTFWLMAASFIALMPLLLLIKPVRKTATAPAPVGQE
jgi:DHA2 family multidrug resistance protein